METLTIYWHPNCGTCKKALKYLDQKKLSYELVDLRDQAPTKKAITQMMNQNYADTPKRLFNTSGQSYRNGGFKETIAQMSSKEMIQALSQDGLLLKRPFVLKKNGDGVVGFKEDEWNNLLSS